MSDAVNDFNSLLRATLGRRRIDTSSLSWDWMDQTPIDALLDPIVLDAADLVTAEQHERLKHCPSCDWIFQDQTRNGRRRWCDMADCGSRAKSRHYYHRTKG